MIGRLLFYGLVAAFVAGVLLGALLDTVWLWLAVGPVTALLIGWALVLLAERTLKGWKII